MGNIIFKHTKTLFWIGRCVPGAVHKISKTGSCYFTWLHQRMSLATMPHSQVLINIEKRVLAHMKDFENQGVWEERKEL